MSTAIVDANGDDFIAGDDLDIQRDVTGVALSDPLLTAWLTLKVEPTSADPGSLQKTISTTQVAGTGQIAQDGGAGNGDGTATVLFQLTKTDTITLGPDVRYYWDIQVKTGSGKVFTGDDGTIKFRSGVTASS